MSRVWWRLSIATFAFMASLLPAHAQDWPTRPIRLLVGFGAGGGTDLAARIVAQPLSEILGQPVVVENRVGAGGTTAANAVVIAAKDGYTLLFAADATVTIAPHLYSKLPYDPQRDLAPVVNVAAGPFVLMAHPSFPPNDVKDLIALVRA